jgi:Cu-Zn family superoxide dismutase
MRSIALVLGSAVLMAASACGAETLKATMEVATPDGPGQGVGVVTITEGSAGATFHLDLRGLPPGPHGFHIHAGDTCAPAMKDGKSVPAGGAGGHMDPGATAMHMGPEGMGHLGDLPRLTVAADGTDMEVLVAPRIKSLEALKGHALMIHAGGDNYADQPAPLGGGGARLACGIIGG